MKQWFRDNIKHYLKVIKAWTSNEITTKVDAAKTQLRTEMNSVSVTGAFKGGFDTVAQMPSGTGTKTGDWAVLKKDDSNNESGIYVKATAGWQFVADIASFDEAKKILATNQDFIDGTSTQKAVTVKQLSDAFSTTVTAVQAQADWDAA